MPDGIKPTSQSDILRISLAKLMLLALTLWAIIDLLVVLQPNISNYRSIIKGIIFLPFIIYYLPNLISRYGLILIVAGGLAISLNFIYPDSYNSILSARLCGFLIVFLTVYESLNKSVVSAQDLNTFFRNILFLVSIGSIISFIFGTSNVYGDDGFSGASGGFNAANEYTYLLIIISSAISVEIIKSNLKVSYSSIFMLFMASILCVLLTTKSAILFVILNSLMVFAYYKKIKYIIISIVLLILLPMLVNLEGINVISRFMFFLERHDLIWAFTSGRSERLEHLSFEQFTLIPEINKDINFEMDILDILINMGILGFLVYIIMFYWAFINFNEKLYYIAITVIIVSLSIFSGHLLNSVAVAPFLAVYYALIRKSINNR